MFVTTLAMGRTLRIGRGGHWLALIVGLTQFCGNYNFVYRAEEHLTSGIVATMIGLMLVPNAILARVLLGQPITRRFAIGSAIALAGIALLLLHEAHDAPAGGNVVLGIVFAATVMLCASRSQHATRTTCWGRLRDTCPWRR